MKKQFLEAGRIVGTHGVRGEMRVEPWCDSADFLKKVKTLLGRFPRVCGRCEAPVF